MTVADYLAGFLAVNGVRHVYGVPGGENVPVMDALRNAEVEYVLCHHETAAGFAADVTGQLTDRPGVCMSTVGPGAVNLAAAAASFASAAAISSALLTSAGKQMGPIA